MLGRVRGNPPGLSLAEDSQANGGVRFDDVSAVGAATRCDTRRPQTATVQTGVGRQALAAQPLIRDKEVVGVAVFADALADVEANVA